MLIGLTGTFGSGKSLVAGMFEACGAASVDADALAREAVRIGSPALEEIRQEFGAEFLLPEGGLDRKRMAEVVFSDRAMLARLNAIVHPRVRDLARRRIERLEAEREVSGSPLLIVYNVPLLFEAGLADTVERIVVVAVTEAERFRRVRLRDGLSEREIVQRLGAQWPQRRKAALADAVVDNSGLRSATREQTQRLYEKWKDEALRSTSPFRGESGTGAL